jgi:Pentapeptide repeats (8 copies)
LGAVLAVTNGLEVKSTLCLQVLIEAMGPFVVPVTSVRRSAPLKMKRIQSVFLRRKRNTGINKPTGLWKRFANFVESSPTVRIWVRLNQSATIFALFVALLGFLMAWHKYNGDIKKDDEDRIAKSWDVVIKMSGKKANGGQVSAIERLVSFSIPLDLVDLHDTYLANANLKGASLRGANLRGLFLLRQTCKVPTLRAPTFVARL